MSSGQQDVDFWRTFRQEPAVFLRDIFPKDLQAHSCWFFRIHLEEFVVIGRDISEGYVYFSKIVLSNICRVLLWTSLRRPVWTFRNLQRNYFDFVINFGLVGNFKNISSGAIFFVFFSTYCEVVKDFSGPVAKKKSGFLRIFFKTKLGIRCGFLKDIPLRASSLKCVFRDICSKANGNIF